MSSGSDSSDMGQKTVTLDLKGSLLVFEGIGSEVFSVDCSEPKLNLKQLYDAVFEGVDVPTAFTVVPSVALKSNTQAMNLFKSVKKIIDDASKEVNEKLPAVIAKRKLLEKTLAMSASQGEDVENVAGNDLSEA